MGNYFFSEEKQTSVPDVVQLRAAAMRTSGA
jgi:hypothetical protein